MKHEYRPDIRYSALSAGFISTTSTVAGSRLAPGLVREDHKTVSYNKNGDPAEEAFVHEEREYGIDHLGEPSETPTRERVSRSEARFRYEYDAHDNWVVKTVESRAAQARTSAGAVLSVGLSATSSEEVRARPNRAKHECFSYVLSPKPFIARVTLLSTSYIHQAPSRTMSCAPFRLAPR